MSDIPVGTIKTYVRVIMRDSWGLVFRNINYATTAKANKAHPLLKDGNMPGRFRRPLTSTRCRAIWDGKNWRELGPIIKIKE